MGCPMSRSHATSTAQMAQITSAALVAASCEQTTSTAAQLTPRAANSPPKRENPRGRHHISRAPAGGPQMGRKSCQRRGARANETNTGGIHPARKPTVRAG
eukprot:7982252-Pyramimonas_sp.AAC.3